MRLMEMDPESDIQSGLGSQSQIAEYNKHQHSHWILERMDNGYIYTNQTQVTNAKKNKVIVLLNLFHTRLITPAGAGAGAMT